MYRETAFKIIESVRKGRGLSDEHKDIMRKSGVPEWYVESCDKIGYLLQKAHTVTEALITCIYAIRQATSLLLTVMMRAGLRILHL